MFSRRCDSTASQEGLLAIAIIGGVLWSNVLAYGGVSLAPYAELVELQQIGKQFAHRARR